MNSSTLATDGRLLLDLLNGRDVPALEQVQLARMLELAGEHGLTTLVYGAMRAREIDPDDWREVAEDLELNAQIQVKAAVEISTAFEAAGIRAVFVKGIALALSVYARPGKRPFVDMDVLIEPQSLKAAAESLRALGYVLDKKSLSDPRECTFAREKLPGFPVSIDLHYGFTGDDGLQAPVRISTSEILDRSHIAQGVRVPTIEDSALLAAANMPRKAAQPFMLVVDFAGIARLKPDWNVIVERAAEAHVRTGMWLGFELARTLLKAPLDSAFLKRVAPCPRRCSMLLNMLGDEQLWRSDKYRFKRYTIWFKLKCLDSRRDEMRALMALPKGILRKLKMTRSLAQREIGGPQ